MNNKLIKLASTILVGASVSFTTGSIFRIVGMGDYGCGLFSGIALAIAINVFNKHYPNLK
jgi:hypothetical protein